ncbi:MAG: aldo/keto reductase [Oscillospiraceae bacterium]|nr:aldo/keto reductase [Oscillospiraceae bacterium]
MQKKQLGSSELQIPPISIGCWSFGGNAEDYWGAQDQQDVDALVALAIDTDANFFDTAYGYNEGRSEESLGKALQGKRDKAIICTKTPICETPKIFEEKLVASLRRLGTEYVDILMIHWPTRDQALLEQNLMALKNMCEKGLVRYAGVSNFGIGTLSIAKSVGVNCIANEFAYSLLSRAPEYDVIPYCVENNIGIVCYMSLMQGILTGKYRAIDDIPMRYRRTVQFDGANNTLINKAHATPPAEAEAMAVVNALIDISSDIGITPGQLALAWCIAKPGVATTFVGCRNAKQLEDNCLAGEVKLESSVISALDEASQPVLDKMGNTVDIFGQNRIW